MINVILNNSSRSNKDYSFPVLNETNEWYGMSTECSNDGNGVTSRPWCSFAYGQTWINTETNKSIIITDDFFNGNSRNFHGCQCLNEYGIEEFKKLLRKVDELEPETEMPDIF